VSESKQFELKPWCLTGWLEKRRYTDDWHTLSIHGPAYLGFLKLIEFTENTVNASWIPDESISANHALYLRTAVSESIPRNESAIIAVMELDGVRFKPVRYTEGEAVGCTTGLELAYAAQDRLKEIFHDFGLHVLKHWEDGRKT